MMEKVDICYGEYAAKWGLTDFYEESEENLMELIASGKDFETEYGCKKEIRYASIRREDGEVIVTVWAHMDDLFDGDDLIYDALWARLHVEEELPGEMIDDIRDFAIDDGIDDKTELCIVLEGAATFEDICEAISTLEDEVEEANTNMFNRLCDLVEWFYKGKEGG